MKKTSLIPLTLALLILAGCSANKPISTVGDDITKKALTSKSVNVCKSLTENLAKQNCIDTVNDSLLTDRAIAAGDKSICVSIKNADYKKACELGATVKETEAKTRQQEEQKFMAAQSGSSLQDCDSLITDAYKEQCRDNVLILQAHDQGNANICNQIKNTDVQKICISGASK
ncbi:MAG: hypothetical protein NTX63_01950 [Candidatus Peregrinibacteria bacterium]|nr:hypothetical protein [Candidatus Peregrinibacteria bacterium]